MLLIVVLILLLIQFLSPWMDEPTGPFAKHIDVDDNDRSVALIRDLEGELVYTNEWKQSQNRQEVKYEDNKGTSMIFMFHKQTVIWMITISNPANVDSEQVDNKPNLSQILSHIVEMVQKHSFEIRYSLTFNLPKITTIDVHNVKKTIRNNVLHDFKEKLQTKAEIELRVNDMQIQVNGKIGKHESDTSYGVEREIFYTYFHKCLQTMKNISWMDVPINTSGKFPGQEKTKDGRFEQLIDRLDKTVFRDTHIWTKKQGDYDVVYSLRDNSSSMMFVRHNETIDCTIFNNGDRKQNFPDIANVITSIGAFEFRIHVSTTLMFPNCSPEEKTRIRNNLQQAYAKNKSQHSINVQVVNNSLMINAPIETDDVFDEFFRFLELYYKVLSQTLTSDGSITIP